MFKGFAKFFLSALLETNEMILTLGKILIVKNFKIKNRQSVVTVFSVVKHCRLIFEIDLKPVDLSLHIFFLEFRTYIDAQWDDFLYLFFYICIILNN